jgi:hypothetical protein
MSNSPAAPSRRPHLRESLWEEQEHLCAWCFELIPLDELSEVTVDHYIPISHRKCGSSNKRANLRVMHQECNSNKGHYCPICDPWVFKLQELRKQLVLGDDHAPTIPDAV